MVIRQLQSFVLLLALLFVSPHAFPKEIPHTISNVKLINCYDGDTCTFRDGAHKIKVRLAGVDAPEKNQQFGRESRDSLSSFIQSAKTIELRCIGRSYKRKVCEIFADGKSASEHQVSRGFAWDAPKYSKGKFRSLQDQAAKGKLGLWSQPNHPRPECFRNPRRKGC